MDLLQVQEELNIVIQITQQQLDLISQIQLALKENGDATIERLSVRSRRQSYASSSGLNPPSIHAEPDTGLRRRGKLYITLLSSGAVVASQTMPSNCLSIIICSSMRSHRQWHLSGFGTALVITAPCTIADFAGKSTVRPTSPTPSPSS